jgi:hypothetical protein
VVPAEPVALDLPRIYLACPLTNLRADRRRVLSSEAEQVKSCIERITVGDRIDAEMWPVTVYAPLDNTAPWLEDGLSPASVYARNFAEVLDSDAVIVLADDAASAGVGQEVEWASRLGVPILYLSSGPTVSRQIEGTPALIRCVAYKSDSATLSAHVAKFLRDNRTRIIDGPRRRASRRLRFETPCTQLRHRWHSCADPTGVAARCALQPAVVDLALADPARVAMLSADTLTMLCAELRVALSPAMRQLPVRAVRALILTAEADGWSDLTVERLRLHALAAVVADPHVDLDTLDAWRRLLGEVDREPR